MALLSVKIAFSSAPVDSRLSRFAYVIVSVVVCGGVVPQQDYDELRAAGAAAIFGPGTKLPVAGRETMRLLAE